MTVVAGTRDVVAVRGPDAVRFLQGQLSADVDGLAAGESTWTFLLQPTGKLGFWLRATRPAANGGTDAEILLDVDAGLGAAVTARLRRFLLRTDAVVEPAAYDSATVVGEGAPVTAEGIAAGRSDVLVLPRVRAAGEDPVALDVLGPVGSLDLHGADGTPADLAAALVPAAWPGSAEAVEDAIPAELGEWVVAASVSFTKGCYTGQELVARVDSRSAGAPFRLRVLAPGPGAAAVAVGDPVLHDGTDRGVVTSVAATAAGPVVLARVHRAVADGDEVLVGGATATVPLPDAP